MPKNDPFTVALKRDWKSLGVKQKDVPEKINMSQRQFTRQLRGETKRGIMAPEVAADLKSVGYMSQETSELYVAELRGHYNLDRQIKSRFGRAALREM